MLVLTFGTEIVDAVGYLGLNRVFTGNTTGNVVFRGMALIGGNGLPVLGPLIALGGFISAPLSPGACCAVLVVEGALVSAVALVGSLHDRTESSVDTAGGVTRR